MFKSFVKFVIDMKNAFVEGFVTAYKIEKIKIQYEKAVANDTNRYDIKRY